MTDKTPQSVDYSNTGPRRHRALRVALFITLGILMYFIVYMGLRASHVIVHYQDMEGDLVAPAMMTKVPGLRAFAPLIRLETSYWKLRHPRDETQP